MANLEMSIQHGQPWEEAKANFERGVTTAQTRYSRHFYHVEWSDNRTSARLTGKGLDLVVSLDEASVHARGQVPLIVRLLERPIRRYVEDAMRGNAPEP
jgi:hypothetical protein